MTPVRALLVCSAAAMGGAERRFVLMASGLPARGIEPIVVVLQAGELVERLEAADVDVITMHAGRLRQPARVVRTVRSLVELARDRRTELVYAHAPKAHLYAGPAAQILRLPCVWSQLNIPSPPGLLIRAASALPADLVLANSERTAEAQRRVPSSPPVRVVYPGTDVTEFHPAVDAAPRRELALAADHVLVSMVGRLDTWKGHELFIRAAKLVADRVPEARFAIVGGALLGWEGSYPSDMRALAQQLGLDERLTFTGHRRDIPEWMAASDIVVNASCEEPFGLVITEAMACARPVVALDAGGPREIVRHGQDGFLCREATAEAMAAAIERLARDSELRRRMGEAGRRRVVDRFSAERLVDEFADLLANLARKEQGRDARVLHSAS